MKPNNHFSIDQCNISERNHQVSQKQEIYQNSKEVLVWLGPDTNEGQAEAAIQSIVRISDFLCDVLSFSISDCCSRENLYREVIYENRHKLPLPGQSDFNIEVPWKSLIWFFSNPYFTRVWVLEELNANEKRAVHCGHETVAWERVELVAGYIILEPAVSSRLGFTNTHCWWAATLTTERIGKSKNWLCMLYLASNFSCSDGRDMIYGLRGLLKSSDSTSLLEPDYNKTLTEVYRDSVEAAFLNFDNADVLLYVNGLESPSWIPRWDKPMLFRNPFRFGNPVPWRPAGDVRPVWAIDKALNILSVSGFVVDTIESAESYNQVYFSNALIDSEGQRSSLKQKWQRILESMQDNHSTLPLSYSHLSAVAMSFSFGLDENSNVADERRVTQNFIGYLNIILDDESFAKFIPPELANESMHADGSAFGKPVWGFEYPESSFIITKKGLVGCSVSLASVGDIVCIISGCAYPLILRYEKEFFRMVGYAYVHQVMRGEMQNYEQRTFQIV